MKRIFTLFFVASLLFANAVNAQPTRWTPAKHLLEYSDFNENLEKQHGDLRRIGHMYDLVTILLLDSTHKEKVFEYNPSLEQTYNELNAKMNDSTSYRQYENGAKDIRHIFKRTSQVEKMIRAVFGEDKNYVLINNLVVKDNKAIVSMTDILYNEKAIYSMELKDGYLYVKALTPEMIFESAKSALESRKSSLGMVVGLGFSSMRETQINKNGGGVTQGSYKSQFAYNLGLIYNIVIDKGGSSLFHYYFQSGLIYARHGGIVSKDEEIKTHLKLDYIKMPINILTKRSSILSKTSFDVHYGFYLAKGVSGRYSANVDGDKVSLNAFKGEQNSSKVNSFDFGVNLGIGFSHKRFSFMVTSESGLTNLLSNGKTMDSNLDIIVKNQVIMFNFIYNFAPRRK